MRKINALNIYLFFYFIIKRFKLIFNLNVIIDIKNVRILKKIASIRIYYKYIKKKKKKKKNLRIIFTTFFIYYFILIIIKNLYVKTLYALL